MDALRTQLRDLAERCAHAPTPEAALRGIQALREHLSAMERAEAAQALQEGGTYGTIGRALGVTRQAAHRRFRHLPLTEAKTSEPPGRVLITSEAREVVRHAREEAAALGVRTVGSEHLLLGVLRCRRSGATDVLAELGVTLDDARLSAQPTLVDADTDATVPAGPAGISDMARQVFERSLREALERGDGYVGVEHLLLAALRDQTGGARRTLEALGVDAGEVRARLVG